MLSLCLVFKIDRFEGKMWLFLIREREFTTMSFWCSLLHILELETEINTTVTSYSWLEVQSPYFFILLSSVWEAFIKSRIVSIGCPHIIQTLGPNLFSPDSKLVTCIPVVLTGIFSKWLIQTVGTPNSTHIGKVQAVNTNPDLQCYVRLCAN